MLKPISETDIENTGFAVESWGGGFVIADNRKSLSVYRGKVGDWQAAPPTTNLFEEKLDAVEEVLRITKDAE